MDRIYPKLREQYVRCRDDLTGKGDRMAGPRTIGIDDVLRAHFLLCDYFIREGEAIALAGPSNPNLLVSAICRQDTTFEGREKWENDFQRCATLFFGLVKNHAFFDGNKRTALLTFLYHLDKLGRIVTVRHKDLETLSVRLAANRLDDYPEYSSFEGLEDAEVKFLADYIRRNTRSVDKRQYLVTYGQAAGILRRFGFDLDDPAGNFIHVVKLVKRRRVLRLFGPEVTEKVSLGCIGFPGWSRQICKQEMARLRKLTGLTYHNGYDSDVFFGNEDSLESLILEYHDPLKRLKDR